MSHGQIVGIETVPEYPLGSKLTLKSVIVAFIAIIEDMEPMSQDQNKASVIISSDNVELMF